MKTTLTALALVLAASAASSAELRMSWWGGDGRHVATQEALKVCGAKFGHVVKPEFTGWQGHGEKVTTQLAGGTEADIMQINWPWLHQFSRDGSGFADLREFAGQIDLSQWTEEQLAGGTMNGKLNGIPVSVTGRVFYFNDAAFQKAGLATPTSWADLAAAAKVMNADDAYPFDAAKLNAIFIVSLAATQATGKDMIDPATGEIAWSEADLVAALNFYQSLVDQGVIRAWKDAVAVGNVELFDDPAWAEGRIGGSYEWDSTYAKYADPLKEGKLVPVPPFQVEGATTDGVYKKPSMVFSISKNSKNPQAAAEIVNCLLNDPEAVLILGDSRGLPASAIALETLTDAGKLSPEMIAATDIVARSTGPAVSPANEHPAVRDAFQSAIEEFAYGQVTAEDAAAMIIKDVQRATARM
jgi:oligogalacturonide transport system substrate-binding protein